MQRIAAEGGGGGNTYEFAKIVSVRVSDDGRIYALDQTDTDIKSFGSDGRFLRTFGRKGAGPGELTGPALRMAISRDQLVIDDLMLRRAVTYTLEGAHVRTANHPPSDGSDVPHATYRVREGWLLDVSPPNLRMDRSGVRTDVWWRLALRGPGGRVDSIGAIRGDMLEYTVSGASGRITESFGSTGIGHGGAYAVLDDTLLVVADGYTGVVRWLAFGETGAITRRTERLAPLGRETTPALFKDFEQQLTAGYRKRSPDRKLAFRNYPPRLSVATSVILAGNGDTWIAAAPEKRETSWTVFPPHPGAPFRVTLPNTFTFTDARGDRLYGYGKDLDDLPILLVYQLTR